MAQRANGEEVFDILQHTHGLQQYLRQVGVVAGFHSANVMGMFRSAWNAAVYSQVAKMASVRTTNVPGEVKFPFVPRMLPVMPTSAAKLLLTVEEQPIEVESAHLISASARMNDCRDGESFLGYYISRAESAATTDANKNFSSNVITPMVNDAREFLSRFLGKPVDLPGAGDDLEALWADLALSRERVADRAPVAVLMVAYGAGDQVGKHVYMSKEYGAARTRHGYDAKAELLAAEGQQTKRKKYQFRVRPWSAAEMLLEARAGAGVGVGAGGVAGFRLMLPGQVSLWNAVYDRMAALLEPARQGWIPRDARPGNNTASLGGTAELGDAMDLRNDTASAKCCCPGEGATEKTPCKVVAANEDECKRWFRPMSCSCLVGEGWRSYRQLEGRRCVVALNEDDSSDYDDGSDSDDE